ncbi:MAG: phosphonate ABC transporter, permease protein PhnE [Chloroflexota bacterium]
MAQAEARRLTTPPSIDFPSSAARRWRMFIVLGALAVAHTIGWQITNIDLPKLFWGLPNMQHIVSSLLRPEAFERNKDVVGAETLLNVLAPGGTASGSRRAQAPGGAQLVVQPSSAAPGQIVNLQGTGWPAGKAAEAFLVQASGAIPRSAGKFEVTPEGTINYAFYVPEYTPNSYGVSVSVTTPRFGFRPTQTLALCLRLMVETLFLALMGTTLSLIFTLPLSFLGAKNLMGGSRVGGAVYYATRTLFNLLRSIEVVIVVTIMAVVVGIGSFAGVLAIVIHSIGALGKLYSEAIESIDNGPIEAISATGATPLQVVRYAVVPQIVPQFLSFTLYRLDINVRMSTIVGLVGGGGIGFILTQYINLLQWSQAGTAIWLIAIVVTGIDYFSAWLREKIV